MTRPIQRKTGKRKTKIPEVQVESNNNDSGTQQTNTQVVKIILEQPKTKPRKRAVKKKDNKKDEAIQELKDEVASYDETINDAKSADIEIPKELGISPSEASSLKTTSDILAFIQQIRVKKEKIKNLSSPPPPEPPGFPGPSFPVGTPPQPPPLAVTLNPVAVMDEGTPLVLAPPPPPTTTVTGVAPETGEQTILTPPAPPAP